MLRARHAIRALLLALAVPVPALQDRPQEIGDRQGDGLSREEMWEAPTAADWEKPCLIQWQRNWDDALALSEETGLAILVCVNMDGEIASEHYAGIRYRQPEVAEVIQQYIPVIASVYRHNPRDFDERGRRIECKRFGTVTCGEHIAIEPILYERYFEGERVAPRHVMIELDGSETYDVYYAFDTASVFERIQTGIRQRDQPEDLRGDRPLLERVASPDSVDHELVEQAYLDGDRETRVRLLRRAVEAREKAPVGLLRLAVFGFDVELARIARQGLASTESADSIDLINEALRVPMDEAEREGLIGALDRIGEEDARARTLAVIHRGLDAESDEVDLDGWNAAAPAQIAQREARREVEGRLDRVAEELAATQDDAEAQLAYARETLALAVDPETARMVSSDKLTGSTFGRLLFEDALAAARKAEALGATGWRVDAIVAACTWYLGEPEEATARAARAVEAMPPGAYDWNTMAVLAIYAGARQDAIEEAVRAKRSWDPEWLTDVNAAYSVLARHPFGTDQHVAAHVDFLVWLGGFRQAQEALDAGLERFPDSWGLHGRLRSRILAREGVAGLERVYEGMLAAPDAEPKLRWHAGYTSLVAAEFHRRVAEESEAWDAYTRGIEHYAAVRAELPELEESCDHFIAMAHAGRARVALERGDDAAAVDELLASFARREASAAELDGLNVNAVATAKMVIARLRDRGQADLSEHLQAALDALDPRLLELPEFERGGPRRGGRDGRGR